MNNKKEVMTVDIDIDLLDELVASGIGRTRLEALDKALSLSVFVSSFKSKSGVLTILDNAEKRIIEVHAFRPQNRFDSPLSAEISSQIARGKLAEVSSAAQADSDRAM